jgi:hypothetical protein
MRNILHPGLCAIAIGVERRDIFHQIGHQTSRLRLAREKAKCSNDKR